MTIEDAPLAELAALLRLADAHVADAAEVLGEAVELRDRLRAGTRRRQRLDVDGAARKWIRELPQITLRNWEK
ncbi:MAG TPA: hypothetical protein P5340_10220 [Defluviicoccus sp.]|nr:hypothetical protein [Defluviicoccus sp.]